MKTLTALTFAGYLACGLLSNGVSGFLVRGTMVALPLAWSGVISQQQAISVVEWHLIAWGE